MFAFLLQGYMENKITVKNLKTGEIITLLDTENGIGNIEAGIPLKRAVDNSLDSFVFTVREYNSRRLFVPYDIVEFTIIIGSTSSVNKYCVLFDHCQSESRYLRTYKHIVNCIELTKYLEKIKIFNFKSTNRNIDLATQFRHALNNAESNFTVGGKSTGIRLYGTTDLYNFLMDKPSRDFELGNTDLRSVLDEMLSLYRCRCEVKDITIESGNITRIDIGYRDSASVSNTTPIWNIDRNGEITGEELDNSGQDFAGSIFARGYNTLSKEPIEIVDTFKSNNSTISDTTASILLPFPISENGIDKFEYTGKFKIVVKPGGGTLNAQLTVDATQIFIPMDIYNLLSEIDRKKKIGYEIGSTEINVGVTYSRIFGIQASVFKDTVLELVYPLAEQYAKDAGFTGISDVSFYKNYYDYNFRLKYTPQVDTVQVIGKQNEYDKDTLLLDIMSGQQAKTLDLERSGKKIASIIRRTGNAEYSIDAKLYDYNNILPLMSKIDLPDTETGGYTDTGYIIYKEEIAVYDNFINCKYYMSKDYEKIIESDGVNREKQIFDIPLESDETPIISRQYIILSDTPFSGITGGNAVITSFFNTLLGINKSGETYTAGNGTYEAKGKLKYMLFKTYGEGVLDEFPRFTENADGNTPFSGGGYIFMRPIASYAQSKSMFFIASVKDNYSVDFGRDGYQFRIWGDGGNRITYNRYVSKVNGSVGECNTFEFRPSTACSYIEQPNEFADDIQDKIKNAPIFEEEDFTLSAAEVQFTYYKDRKQKPLFTLIYEVRVAENLKDKLIIGSEFIKHNNLVTDNGDGLTGLTLITSSSSVFDKEDEYIKSDYIISSTGSVSTFFELVEEVTAYGTLKKLHYLGGLSGVTSWAIIDSHNNIYLAGNEEPTDIYANIRIFPNEA